MHGQTMCNESNEQHNPAATEKAKRKQTARTQDERLGDVDEHSRKYDPRHVWKNIDARGQGKPDGHQQKERCFTVRVRVIT